MRKSTRTGTLAGALAGALLILGFAGHTFAESERGKLYMVTKTAVLTPRAGTPCLSGEGTFCNRSYQCPPGQVARGLVMNLDSYQGSTGLSGLGVACVDPNQLQARTEIGAFGESFPGKLLRDTCDPGFFLAGTVASTSDRRNVSGVARICRRYWPVEERRGQDTYGSGNLHEPVRCGGGEFVTGLKVSYHVGTKDDGSVATVVRNFRFYCSEMRRWIGDPEKTRDPRDPEIRR